MPRYTLETIDTEEQIEVEMSLEDLETLLKSDDNLRQVFRINYCYRVGKLPVSEAWRERLKKIKKNSPGSNMDIP